VRLRVQPPVHRYGVNGKTLEALVPVLRLLYKVVSDGRGGSHQDKSVRKVVSTAISCISSSRSYHLILQSKLLSIWVLSDAPWWVWRGGSLQELKRFFEVHQREETMNLSSSDLWLRKIDLFLDFEIRDAFNVYKVA
jgi:hypothetical protein